MACRVGGLSLALVALVAVQTANGNERPPYRTSPATPAWSWTGFYVGGHVGAGWGQANFSNPIRPSLFGDDVTTPAFLGGVQAGYNWQPADRWVVGVEADASILSSHGTNTCLQGSSLIIGSTCKAKPLWMATVTGRAGRAVGPNGRTLLYVKGGAAFLESDVSLNPNRQYPGFLVATAPRSADVGAWGWTAGTGVEQALTPAWSLKLEYNYTRFAGKDVATPATYAVAPSGAALGIPSLTSVMTQDLHLLKAGLNYRWGTALDARWNGASQAYAARAPEAASGWEFDVGARYWYSSGKHQWDNTLPTQAVQSRLTYDNMIGSSGEVFARLDTPSVMFVKGFFGGGHITRGKMNDEDWGINFGGNFVSYSNTDSNPIQGPMTYGTADVGGNILRTQDHKVGLFAGYNYFYESMDARGCSQIANPSSNICTTPIPASTLVITQTAKWQSLRVGVAAETKFGERWKLSGDLAYLPYVRFEGIDTHWLRSILFYQSGVGNGVQTELVATYRLDNGFSVGLGGRYWAMWVPNGNLSCSTCTGAQQPVKVSTERYGIFAQINRVFATGQ